MELTSTNYLPSYTVGVDAYKAVPEVTRRFGSTAVIIGGKTAMEKAAPRLLADLEGTGVMVTDQIWYGGQPRHSVAEKLAADPRVQAADMVFGMGGGRAIDETKEIAELAGKPLFTFPTVASNCAPVTAIGVFYKEDGSVDNSCPRSRRFTRSSTRRSSPRAPTTTSGRASATRSPSSRR